MNAEAYVKAVDLLEELVALREIKARIVMGIATPTEIMKYEMRDLVWSQARLQVALVRARQQRLDRG